MRVLRTIAELRRARAGLVGPVGLVPTMGALHAGHVSLARAARAECATVAASIFVNPTQFGAGEDLARYPRTFAEDCELLEREGVDLVFAPAAEEMYPRGRAGTVVDVPGIGDRLDGASRPGHFRGVATVVAKLFHIVQPDRAYFGQKDAAQVAVLRAMVRDLDFAVEVRVCATVRDADGLALSSRNRFLSVSEREAALALPRALERAQELLRDGVCSGEALRAAMLSELAEVRVEYCAVVDPDTLEPVAQACGRPLIAVAAWVGTTRLIDNVVVGA